MKIAPEVNAKAVFRDAFSRIRERWSALMPLAVCWVAFSMVFSLAEAGVIGEAAALATLVMAVFAMLILGWKLTRVLASARQEERGDLVAWFVWGIVAALPGLLLVGLLIWFEPDQQSSIAIEIVLGALAVSAAVPVWIYSTGKAIDAQAITLGDAFSAWTKAWIALAIGLFSVAALDLALTEILLPEGLDEASYFEIGLRALIVSIVYAATTVINLAILVSAWRNTPAIIAPDDQLG